VRKLKVYRRHTARCVKGYPQNHRIYRPQTATARKKDCACPIVATGTLANEKTRLQHVGLETNDWDRAEQQAQLWEKWQSTVPPVALPSQNPTMNEAVQQFIDYNRSVTSWEPATHKKYQVLFEGRLLPFCEIRRLTHITHLDDPALAKQFVASWKNLNPTRNKKIAGPLPDLPLGHRTKVNELNRFDNFCEFCVSNKWHKHNHATDIKAKMKYVKPDHKYGLERDEEQRVFDAVELVQDGNGRLNQYNAKELRVFCLVMRHSGLRISDVTTLNESQLVKRESGEGWALRVLQQKKRKKANPVVTVPIPASVEAELRTLTFKNGNHWFCTGQGKVQTAVKNWSERVTKLLKLAQNGKPFNHPASPHTFRHTFSIRHLNAGTNIKDVARWLGDTVATVEKHYAHAIKSTLIASEKAYDESMNRQGY
jgi:integrase